MSSPINTQGLAYLTLEFKFIIVHLVLICFVWIFKRTTFIKLRKNACLQSSQTTWLVIRPSSCCVPYCFIQICAHSWNWVVLYTRMLQSSLYRCGMWIFKIFVVCKSPTCEGDYPESGLGCSRSTEEPTIVVQSVWWVGGSDKITLLHTNTQ